MASTTRITDPTQLPVQLNVQVPFEFREHLIEVARKRRISLSELVRSTLQEALTDDTREATRLAGSTR